MIFKDDFREQSRNSTSQIQGLVESHRFQSIRKLFVQLLYKLRLVSNLEETCNLGQIKSWTFSIRGHYTNLTFEETILKEIWNETQNIYALNPVSAIESSDLVIQYRLGDLTNLPNKSFVSKEMLIKLINEFMQNSDISSISVFTDSAEVALNKLQVLESQLRIYNLHPVQTIYHGVIAKEFIGTNSKLSLWIALFRGQNNTGSIMPMGFHDILKRNLTFNQFQQIRFYSALNNSAPDFFSI